MVSVNLRIGLMKAKETTKARGKGKGMIEVVKKRLRTSEEVYNRIKWDKRFDPNDYILIYEDRFLGMKVTFDPDLNVPSLSVMRK